MAGGAARRRGLRGLAAIDRAGSFVGAVYGEMTSTIMRGDGNPSASRWRRGAGREALLVRYHIGHGTVAPRDQVQFKIAAA